MLDLVMSEELKVKSEKLRYRFAMIFKSASRMLAFPVIGV